MRIRRWVCLFGVTWPDTWHIVSKPLSCFQPLSTCDENIISSRKNISRRHALSLLQYDGNEHPPLRTPQNLSTPKSLAEENSASSLTVQKKETIAFFQHFNRLLFLSSRMNANSPGYSRHDVRYGRINLKTIDPRDLVDEENLQRRHVIDSSHFNINNPFVCWRDLFLLWSWHPTRAYEAVWQTPEAPFEEPSCFFWGLSGRIPSAV